MSEAGSTEWPETDFSSCREIAITLIDKKSALFNRLT
jgi:hypothetical protein